MRIHYCCFVSVNMPLCECCYVLCWAQFFILIFLIDLNCCKHCKLVCVLLFISLPHSEPLQRARKREIERERKTKVIVGNGLLSWKFSLILGSLPFGLFVSFCCLIWQTTWLLNTHDQLNSLNNNQLFFFCGEPKNFVWIRTFFQAQ